jgi:hypothetical protein
VVAAENPAAYLDQIADGAHSEPVKWGKSGFIDRAQYKQAAYAAPMGECVYSGRVFFVPGRQGKAVPRR